MARLRRTFYPESGAGAVSGRPAGGPGCDSRGGTVAHSGALGRDLAGGHPRREVGVGEPWSPGSVGLIGCRLVAKKPRVEQRSRAALRACRQILKTIRSVRTRHSAKLDRLPPDDDIIDGLLTKAVTGSGGPALDASGVW